MLPFLNLTNSYICVIIYLEKKERRNIWLNVEFVNRK